MNGSESGSGNVRAENVLVVRLGHGANCSSVGSVIDTLFISAAVGGAVFAAICAAMKDEDVRVVGEAVREGDEKQATGDRRQAIQIRDEDGSGS